MLFKSKESSCILEVLRILSKGKSRYGIMKKGSSVSHTTLQRALDYLIKESLIKKHDLGHMKVEYEITEKGRKILGLLNELYVML